MTPSDSFQIVPVDYFNSGKVSDNHHGFQQVFNIFPLSAANTKRWCRVEPVHQDRGLA